MHLISLSLLELGLCILLLCLLSCFVPGFRVLTFLILVLFGFYFLNPSLPGYRLYTWKWTCTFPSASSLWINPDACEYKYKSPSNGVRNNLPAESNTNVANQEVKHTGDVVLPISVYMWLERERCSQNIMQCLTVACTCDSYSETIDWWSSSKVCQQQRCQFTNEGQLAQPRSTALWRFLNVIL